MSRRNISESIESGLLTLRKNILDLDNLSLLDYIKKAIALPPIDPLQNEGFSKILAEAHFGAIEQLSKKAKPFVEEKNHIHIPRYFEYLLSLKTEDEIQYIDRDYLAPESDIPSKILVDVLQNYPQEIKNCLLKLLNEDYLQHEALKKIKDFDESASRNGSKALGLIFFNEEIEPNSETAKFESQKITDNIADHLLDDIISGFSQIKFQIQPRDQLAKKEQAPLSELLFSEEGSKYIAYKLRSQDKQVLLETLGILYALGKNDSYGGAIEHFCETVDSCKIDQLSDRINSILGTEKSWMLKHIFNRFQKLKIEVAKYHSDLKSNPQTSELIRLLSIGSTEKIIAIINQLAHQKQGRLNLLTIAIFENNKFGANTSYINACKNIFYRGDAYKIFTELLKYKEAIPQSFWMQTFNFADAIDDKKPIFHKIAQELLESKLLRTNLSDLLGRKLTASLQDEKSTESIVNLLDFLLKIALQNKAALDLVAHSLRSSANYNGANFLKIILKKAKENGVLYKIINAKDSSQLNAVNSAIIKGINLDCIKILLQNGAILNKKPHLSDKESFDDATFADNNKKPEFSRFIKKAAARQKILHDFILSNQEKIGDFFQIIKQDEDKEYPSILINSKNNRNRQNALHLAITSNCDVSTIDLLIANGADIDIQNQLGATPLYLAVKFANYQAITILLEKGADLDIKNNKGRNAFEKALERSLDRSEDLQKNGLEAVRIFLEYDAKKIDGGSLIAQFSEKSQEKIQIITKLLAQTDLSEELTKKLLKVNPSLEIVIQNKIALLEKAKIFPGESPSSTEMSTALLQVAVNQYYQ